MYNGIWLRKSEEKRQLGRHRDTWDDDIKMVLQTMR
jgi:hypothetical protein